MKKIPFFLLGALILGMASAFTTAKSATFTIAYGSDNGQTYQVNVEDVGVTYRCDDGNKYCLYQDQALTIPLPGEQQNKQFVKLP